MHSKRSVFLFAHQDDEFGVFAEIERCVSQGDRVTAIYLTSGEASGNGSPERNAESREVLYRLGVEPEEIYFIGEQLHVPDGKLVEHLSVVLTGLLALGERIGRGDALYLLAWEGGHQDHDAAHLVGLALAKVWECQQSCWQFTLYTGASLPGPCFRLFAPLLANGLIHRQAISWQQRLRFIRYCFLYPSQRKTWIGLFPFFLCHQLVWGTQILQLCSPKRVCQPPHPGRLLYERRGFYNQNEFFRQAQPFIETHICAECGNS